MNPLYQQYQNNGNFLQRFQQFQKTFKGDPQQMIQQMLNSGKISQQQVNEAAKKANELMKMFR